MPLLTNYELHFENSTLPLFVMSLVTMNSMNTYPRLFRIVHLIEFVFLFAIASLLWYLIYSVGKFRLYHKNIIVLIQLFCLSYYFSIFSRAITFAYEMEAFTISGTLACDWPLIVCTFFRMEFMVIYCFVVPVMIAERSFATYYIADYEKEKRSWIAVLLFLSVLLTAAVVVITVMRGFLGMELVLVFLVSVVLWVVLFLCVYTYNRRKLRLLKKHFHTNEKYTLSIRFQLTENLKVMKQLIILAFVLSILIIVALYFVYSAVVCYQLSTVDGQISAALFEMWFSVAPVILCACFVLLNIRCGNVKFPFFGNKSNRYVVEEDINKAKDDATKLHFSILSSFW